MLCQCVRDAYKQVTTTNNVHKSCRPERVRGLMQIVLYDLIFLGDTANVLLRGLFAHD